MSTTAGAQPPSDRGPLLGALLRLAHRSLVTAVERELAGAGYDDLQQAHFAATQPLWDRPGGVRLTELAALGRITKQSMGALLDHLEARGYVERVDDPDDRRARLVRLTGKGMGLALAAREAVRRVEADWSSRVGARRIDALRETLQLIVASLDV
jgi:DNA-binding MarR family transcriptional regulator